MAFDDQTAVRLPAELKQRIEAAAKEVNMPVAKFIRSTLEIMTRKHLEDMQKAISDYEEICAITERAQAVVDEQLRIYSDLKAQSTKIAGVSIPLVKAANEAAAAASRNFGV